MNPEPFRGLPAGSELMVAFSGGVDSSVAAHLCKQAGYRVRAVTNVHARKRAFQPGKSRSGGGTS